ncbi:hypothetical protein CWI39_1384p0010, partial [Hamiltosporidium magnivora]
MLQNCEQHLRANSLPSSSYPTTTHPPPSQTCSNMQNSGLDTLALPYTPLPSSVERMPRNGWTELQLFHNKKFAQCEMVEESKSEQDRERRGIEIGKVMVRTRKHPNELVDSEVLDLVNRIIGEYADSHVILTITDENIESKISKLLLSKDILEKARKQKKLSFSETKNLKKIMREFNFNLSSVTDLSEAKVKKNGSLNVYEKKIMMHESKKQFRKENRMFEVFQSRFYRELTERVESEHVVSRDEIVSFWSTMWNKNDDTVTYDDYLIQMESNNHPTMFPSLDQFSSIINWLPNWKAARNDGIHDFFIKKLTNLHKYLYDIAKAVCLEVTLQADCLSPLLFVLGMDHLSRMLNEKYTKVKIHNDAYTLSIDLICYTLEAMTDKEKQFEDNLIRNNKNTATNDNCYIRVYKYLGIIEDSKSNRTRNSFDEVQSKLIARVERLCRTRLTSKYLFYASNQLSHRNDAVRAVLVKNKIHLRPGCKERLYLPRTELGRGLHSVELRSEHMLLQFLDRLEKHKDTSNRRAAILKVENNITHLSLIKGFLKVKYRLVEEVTKKSLEEAQLAKLYNEIEKRKLHSKLYKARKNELVSVSDSTRWLKRGNIRPRNNAVFCYIQDRNVFRGADG